MYRTHSFLFNAYDYTSFNGLAPYTSSYTKIKYYIQGDSNVLYHKPTPHAVVQSGETNKIQNSKIVFLKSVVSSKYVNTKKMNRKWCQILFGWNFYLVVNILYKKERCDCRSRLIPKVDLKIPSHKTTSLLVKIAKNGNRKHAGFFYPMCLKIYTIQTKKDCFPKC